MTRMLSGNRGDPRLRADRTTFAPGLGEGAMIASLTRPFGPATRFTGVDVPPELALANTAVTMGASAAAEYTSYAIKVRATSADGRREQTETLVFTCLPAQPVAVLVVIGDSNARGAAADEATLAYDVDPQVTTWDGAGFVAYAPGVRTGCTVPNTVAGSEGRVGPELQFARAFRAANAGMPVAIVKYARAGSFQGFGSGAPVNGDASNSWDVASGTLLAGARAQLQAALTALAQAGASPRVVAVIEAIGTNDAGDATLSAGVQTAKAAMIGSIRSTWPVAATTAFLIQRVRADSPQPYLATVRAAQAAVANATADAMLVDTDGLSANPGDPTHFDSAGQLALGAAHHAAATSRMNRRTLALGAKLLFLVDAAAPGTIGLATAPAAGSVAATTGGRILSQATAAKQPALVPAGLAGRAALEFDGTDDGLALLGANGLGSVDAEGFAIVASDAPASAGAAGCIYARGSGSDPGDLRLGRTVVSGVSRFRLRVGIGGGLSYQVVADQVVAEGGPFVLHWRISGTTVFLSVNGAPEQSASLTAAPAIGNASLYIGQANASQFFDGRVRLVGECAPLTTAERRALLVDLLAEAGL